MSSIAVEVKKLEEEVERLRLENEQLRNSGKRFPDPLTIRWIAEQFRKSADIVTFPDGIPENIANEIPRSYDRIIQILLKKWEQESESQSAPLV